MLFPHCDSFKAVGKLLTPRRSPQKRKQDVNYGCNSSEANLRDLLIKDHNASSSTFQSSFMDIESNNDSSSSLNSNKLNISKQFPNDDDDNEGSFSYLDLEEKPRTMLTRCHSLKRLGELLTPKSQKSYFRSKSISNMKSILMCDVLNDSSHRDENEDDHLSFASDLQESKKLDADLKIQSAILEVEEKSEEIKDSITKNLDLAKYRFQQLDRTSSSLANKIVATNAMGRVLELETEHFRMGVIIKSLRELKAQIDDNPHLIHKVGPKIDKILAIKATMQEDKQDVSMLSSEDLLLELERRL